MKHYPLIGALALIAAVSMTSCIDDKYDLSDIDATTEINVKDLVIPINLDKVTLGDIIDLNEGSELVNFTTPDGESFYALRKSGSFDSQAISIPGFSIPAPLIESQSIDVAVPEINIPGLPGVDISGMDIPGGPLSIPVEAIKTDLNFESGSIDDAIVSIDDIYTGNFTIAVTFTCSNFSSGDSPKVPELNVSLPKGLIISNLMPAGSTYDKEQGILTVKNLGFDNRGIANISLTASGIEDLVKNGYYNEGNKENPISINEELTIKEFNIEVSKVPNLNNNHITLQTSYTIDGFSVNEVTGTIRYSIDGIDIPTVDITGLPDFLSGDDTNLVLANPQIYLTLNNPLDQYNLRYTSGLSITQIRNNGEMSNPLMPESDIVVAQAANPNKPYNFCLSPSENNLYLKKEYSENFTHINFPELCNVIAGKGIPASLKIALINPSIPEQKVERFRLNSDLNPVFGHWEILAPLALKADSNSEIIYSDKQTGWYNNDMKDLEISELTISMIADSELSLSAELTGNPIDKDGKVMSNVTVSKVELKGNTRNQDVTISVKGDIRNLDGFKFTAKVTSGSDAPLSENQTLTLSKIRAKVSGKYVTNFK